MAKPAVPLHDYQRKWFFDASRWKIGMFARQTGKTFTTTLEIVDECYAEEAQGRKSRWVILSRGERQAAEAMTDGVHRHARAYGMAVREIAYDVTFDDETYRALDCVLPGGSRITALPANPDTARGFSAHVFLDEFAFHKDSRRIWAALFPVVSAGKRLRITSTPNGKGNKFYELMTETGAEWSKHRCDIHQAVADGLERDVEGMRSAMNDDEFWEQEFEIKWRDGASAWIDYDLLNSAEHPDAGIPESAGRGPIFIGNDIARRRDLWVAWVVETVGDVLWTREISTLRGATFSEQDAELDRLANRWMPRRIAMDQTGMGEKPVEDAKRRYGRHLVEGVVFSPVRRLDLATELKTRFEDRRIRIPVGDRALRTDLHSIKRIAGPTGAPRLVVESDEGADSHSDRFWAAALACGAAALGPAQFGYRPIVAETSDGIAKWRNRPDHSGDVRRRRGNADFAGRIGRTRGVF